MTCEKKLIRKIEYGDREALGELIEMYYPDILRYCRFHTFGRVCAEDAAQETFLKVVRYMDVRSFRGEFRPFLYKIAQNTCIDLARKRCCNDDGLEDLEWEIPYLETGFGKAEEDAWLHQLISRLEPEIQELVLLRFGQDLTLGEIAEVMGIPMRTVQSKLRTTLKRLKTDLTDTNVKKEAGTYETDGTKTLGIFSESENPERRF